MEDFKYMAPVALIIQYHPNGGYCFYTVDLVWSANAVTYGQRKFMTYKDVTNWCEQEYNGVEYSLFA
jgi:hypothetical protein